MSTHLRERKIRIPNKRATKINLPSFDTVIPNIPKDVPEIMPMQSVSGNYSAKHNIMQVLEGIDINMIKAEKASGKRNIYSLTALRDMAKKLNITTKQTSKEALVKILIDTITKLKNDQE